MTKGKFITFEGIDGCGKTTQINLLEQYLKQKQLSVFLTLEPGGSDIGKQLRQILLHYDGYVDDMCELLMYLADRSQHVKTVILQKLNEGNFVLCDRYIDSTVAYQGYARGFDIETINTLNKIATNSLLPDLTFVFDIEIETAQARLGKTKDRLEKESLDFHKKVQKGYIELSKLYPERIKLINANKSIEEIFEEVKKYIDKLL
ncbi:dTMP kinase [bacterium]|nr:dTMP kinase [bacterium]